MNIIMKFKNLLLLLILAASNRKIVGQQLYGMTSYGGANDLGVIFEYDAGLNIYTKKYDLGGSDGGNAQGSLINPVGSKLMGMCWGGGAHGVGTIFEFDYASTQFSKRIDFSDSTGSRPYGNLYLATNGKYYGLTYNGGANVNNTGVLFEFNPTTGNYSKKIDFNNFTTGMNARGSLIQASNGKLYGLTYQGGINGGGVLFEFNISMNICVVKFSFGTVNGYNPLGSLIEANNGKLYGLTQHGGANDLGVIFEYDISTNTFSKKIDMSYSIGAAPVGSLVQANNGKLYGLTASGGINNAGTLFEYDHVSNVYTKKIDLVPSTGKLPQGSLMQASNHKLYGVTSYGGTNDMGVIFEYDITNNTYTKKVDFIGLNGSKPEQTLLVEVNPIQVGIDQINKNNYYVNIYPNPTNGLVIIDLKKNSQIIVTNTLGEIVLMDHLNIGKQHLNIQNQPAGIYFVKIVSEKTQQTFKLVKE
jgi:uncharacterized repeat protein (TIGR03803 family)